jgi:hypothetical protein
MELTIDIGDANLVKVDEGDSANGGADERFDCPGADAAESNDRDVAFAESFECFGAIKAGDSTEAVGRGHC